jgi:hypothetical protein
MSKDFAPSRRQLFKGGAMLAVALPGASAVIGSAAAKPFEMQDLADWKAHVGKDFTVGGASMTLVEVSKGVAQSQGKRGHNFTAIFEMKAGEVQTGLHTVAQAELGQASLYLQSNARPDGAQARVHASFN